MRRFALVTGLHVLAEQIARYMPGNYKVLGTVECGVKRGVLIGGIDRAGWTMEDYIIPRLASGLYGCKEVSAEEVANLMFDHAFGIEYGRYMDEDSPSRIEPWAENQADYERMRDELFAWLEGAE